MTSSTFLQMDPTFQAHPTTQQARQEYQPGKKCISISKEIEQIMTVNASAY